jgi:hypothetical protein
VIMKYSRKLKAESLKRIQNTAVSYTAESKGNEAKRQTRNLIPQTQN